MANSNDTPDFAAIIDRAIARETRTNLASFLTSYDHLEFGRIRKLDGEEIALVMSAVDAFLVDDSFASLGIAEISNLQERLSFHVVEEKVSPTEALRLRNACFDALACIKSLEARLTGLLAHAAVWCRRPAIVDPANDT